MASRMKKLIAIIMAAVTVAASVPVIYASAVDGTATEETTDSEQQTVMEDGEVVQEGATGKVDIEDQITLEKHYKQVAESDTYRMYYYEPRLSVILENKQTGKLIESTLSDAADDGLSNAAWNGYMKSGIVLTAVTGTVDGVQVDLVNTPNKIKTKEIKNGISAEIYFEGVYEFGLTVEVTLEGDELVVNIPNDSIKEDKEGTYIGTVSVFPMMGYTHLGDQNGYMLVPDGNGALINLDNKEGRYSSGYSQMIYGKDYGFKDTYTQDLLWDRYQIIRDSNDILAPIFGMAHLDDQLAYLAVVEKGDTRASIECQPNGAMVNYNRCFAKFILRLLYKQPTNTAAEGSSNTVLTTEGERTKTDMKVRYMLLSGEDANYSGMAVSYRNYLLENGLIAKKDTSYNSRVDFLGSDRESFLFSTKAVPVTTVDQIEEMYGELQGKGVDSLLTVYKGWQKGGLYNVPISKYKADSHIGGTAALTKLIKESEANNYDIYLYNDALQINADTNAMTFNAVKMVNKKTLTINTHQQVYDKFYFQLPSKSKASLKSLVSSYTKKDVNNLAVAGISNHLFSYTAQGKKYGRQDTADVYADAFDTIDSTTNLILEQPSAYLWKYTDAILDLPLGTSDFMYENEEVPFLSLVLKGLIPMYSDYVNLEANKTKFFLQMVESGVYPSFYLTYENSSKLIYTNSCDLYSTEFTTYRDTVVSYDKELRAVSEKVGDSCIMKHEKLENGIVKVTYENGVAIYVNYTENDLTADGMTIGALSYKVGEAE